MTENQSISLELKLNDSDDVSMLLGTHDKHIKYLEENAAVTINTRGETIQLLGEEAEVQLIAAVLKTLQVLIQRGIKISTPDVVSALKMARSGDLDAFVVMYEQEILKDHHGRAIRIKNVGQKNILMQSEIVILFLESVQQEQVKPS
ncbi:PhoH-like protein [Enterococcus termitis]